MRGRRAASLLTAGAVGAALFAAALEPSRSRRPPREAPAAVPHPVQARMPYDGRFTFARVRYGGGGGRSIRFGRGGGGSSAWSHDYPNADRNMSALLEEITTVHATE